MARKTKEEMVLQKKTIFDLYIAGNSLSEIAVRTGLDYRTVQTNLKNAVTEIDVTKTLEIEMARDLTSLQVLFKTFWPMATATGKYDGGEPSLEHAEFIVKVLDRKAKLLGLDANKRIDIYAIVETFAHKHGLDTADVIDVIGDLLPSPTERH